jgi:transcriptional regulator with XRE-family HTH domain
MAKLTELGHPIPVSSISRLENGERRADVSDLVAIAVALDVSPARLYLPEGKPGDSVELTETFAAPWERAWLWATGQRSLKGGPPAITLSHETDSERAEAKTLFELEQQWRRENGPYEFSDEPVSSGVVLEYFDEFAALRRAVEGAVGSLPPLVARKFLRMMMTRYLIAELKQDGIAVPGDGPDGG